MVVRVFDGSKRLAIGEVALALEIGPRQFEVPFAVIDILGTFNMLLGQP